MNYYITSLANNLSLRRLRDYLLANLISFLPAAGAVAVLMAAHLIVTLAPTTACDDSSYRTNWFFCSDDKAIQSMLGRALAHPVAVGAERAPTVMALKEARARTAWALSLGVLLLVAVATALGGFYLACDASRQQARRLGSKKATRSITVPAGMLFVLGMLVLAFILLNVEAWLLHVDPGPFLFGFFWIQDPSRIVASDGAMSWLTTFDPTVSGHLGRVYLLVAIAILALMAAVTTSLHQAPEDRQFREEPGDDKTLGDTGTTDADLKNRAYRRVLGRSFERLRYAIYLGSALLAATLAEVSARYSWPSAVVQATQQDVAEGFDAFAISFATEIGVFFTLFLAALYFPALTILRERERARSYYRSRVASANAPAQEQWLKDEGLTFSISANWGEFIAVIAPGFVGTIGHFTKLFG